MDGFKAVADIIIIGFSLFYFGAGVASNRAWMALLCISVVIAAWRHLNRLGAPKDR
jgi:hypothetical protein